MHSLFLMIFRIHLSSISGKTRGSQFYTVLNACTSCTHIANILLVRTSFNFELFFCTVVASIALQLVCIGKRIRISHLNRFSHRFFSLNNFFHTFFAWEITQIWWTTWCFGIWCTLWFTTNLHDTSGTRCDLQNRNTP